MNTTYLPLAEIDGESVSPSIWPPWADTLARDTHLFQRGWVRLGAGTYEVTAAVEGALARTSVELDPRTARVLELVPDGSGPRWAQPAPEQPERMLANARAAGPSCAECHTY